MRWTLVLEMNEMKVIRKICNKVNSIFWKILLPVSFCYDPLVLKKFFTRLPLPFTKSLGIGEPAV